MQELLVTGSLFADQSSTAWNFGGPNCDSWSAVIKAGTPASRMFPIFCSVGVTYCSAMHVLAVGQEQYLVCEACMQPKSIMISVIMRDVPTSNTERALRWKEHGTLYLTGMCTSPGAGLNC